MEIIFFLLISLTVATFPSMVAEQMRERFSPIIGVQTILILTVGRDSAVIEGLR